MSIKISERAKRESKKQEAEERLSLVERYESVMESMIDRLTSLETDYSDACDLIAEQDEEIRERSARNPSRDTAISKTGKRN